MYRSQVKLGTTLNLRTPREGVVTCPRETSLCYLVRRKISASAVILIPLKVRVKVNITNSTVRDKHLSVTLKVGLE